MALIDKDQLKAEIERLVKLNKECAKGGGDRVFLEGIAAGYADVISFLDTIPEQPVEGLEEAAEEHAGLNFDRQMEYKSFWNDVDTFIAGAEWQKVQDQKTIELAEDHAMLAGMNKMEQQMMEKAYDTIMQFDELDDLVPTFENMQKFGFKEGDKVKVIILKEK